MAKKFFLFRRSEPQGPAKRFSENGVDIPILGIPADQIAFITAGRGEINITFNGAGMYEENELFVGDSIEKTNITISCKDGEELQLIEKIMLFASNPEGRVIMKFDVVENKVIFDNAVVSSVSTISAKIKSQPTERVSQKISTGDVKARFQNVIGEINFGSRDNKPFIDYNHRGMYSVDNTDIIAVAAAEWKNSGTGGPAYNITGGTGSDGVTTQTEATAATVGLSQSCAQFGVNSFLNVPDVTIKDDYTMYFVIGDAGAGSSGNGFGVLFGDDAGETTGFSALGNPDIFTMRHAGLDGEPFKIKTSSKTSGTEPYQFPDRSSSTNIGERQFCYVFILRRDKQFNLYLYNHEGELVAFVPALTAASTTKTIIKEVKSKSIEKNKKPYGKSEVKDIPKVTPGTPGRTDGNLLIQQLGTTNSSALNGFTGTLGRFGVIKRDVGDAVCSQLAQDLYELYKPSL